MRLVAAGDRSTTTVAGASASDSLDMWQCYASDGIMSGPMRSLVERGGGRHNYAAVVYNQCVGAPLSDGTTTMKVMAGKGSWSKALVMATLVVPLSLLGA